MIALEHKGYILNFNRSERSSSTNLETTQWAYSWLTDCNIPVQYLTQNGQCVILVSCVDDYQENQVLDIAKKAMLSSLIYIENHKVTRFYLNGDSEVLGTLNVTEYPTKSSYLLGGEYWDLA